MLLCVRRGFFANCDAVQSTEGAGIAVSVSNALFMAVTFSSAEAHDIPIHCELVTFEK
jgi:hypothetical protein